MKSNTITITLCTILIAGWSWIYAATEPESCGFCGLRSEVHYFSIHLQQRLGDRTFNRKGWTVDRMLVAANRLGTTVEAEGSQADVTRDAVDVAIAAMMVAHGYQEGAK